MNSGSTPIDETPINVLPHTRPDTDPAGRAHLLIWGVAGGALFIAVGMALGTLLNVPVFGMRTPSGPSLGLSLLRSIGIGPLDWLACAVSSPLFVWLARRFPINRRQWNSACRCISVWQRWWCSWSACYSLGGSCRRRLGAAVGSFDIFSSAICSQEAPRSGL